MNFLQGKNGMERASFDAVWPHLPCLPFSKIRFRDIYICPFKVSVIK